MQQCGLPPQSLARSCRIVKPAHQPLQRQPIRSNSGSSVAALSHFCLNFRPLPAAAICNPLPTAHVSDSRKCLRKYSCCAGEYPVKSAAHDYNRRAPLVLAAAVYQVERRRETGSRRRGRIHSRRLPKPVRPLRSQSLQGAIRPFAAACSAIAANAAITPHRREITRALALFRERRRR